MSTRRPPSRLVLVLWACTVLLALPGGPAWGHEVRPAYLEIVPAGEGWRVRWRQPVTGDAALALRPVLSGGWLDAPATDVARTPGHLVREWAVPANAAPLPGQQLTIEGLERTITDTLVRVQLHDGTVVTRLLKPEAPSMRIAGGAPGTPAVAAYFQLGVEHILWGIDHLLFVLGLLLLVRGRALLLATLTAFTAAHSVTLGLAALGLVQVPVPLVEATIALSILFVAVEAVKLRRGQPGLSSRRPWAVAAAFGLLHGLGFASALAEVGLPRDAALPALLLFNLGVEAGQLAFVAAVLALAGLLRRCAVTAAGRARWVAPYAIGTLAGFWFVERSLEVFNA